MQRCGDANWICWNVVNTGDKIIYVNHMPMYTLVPRMIVNERALGYSPFGRYRCNNEYSPPLLDAGNSSRRGFQLCGGEGQLGYGRYNRRKIRPLFAKLPDNIHRFSEGSMVLSFTLSELG